MKIAATFIPKTIQRTIAKQAIKILWLVRLVAREIFTFFILKKFIIIHTPIIHLLGPFGLPLFLWAPPGHPQPRSRPACMETISRIFLVFQYARTRIFY
jgi:hypothetical protein